MCVFTQSVYVAVDDLMTEVLRQLPSAALVASFPEVVLKSLTTQTFGEKTKTKVGKVSQEQMRRLLRRMHYRLPTDQKIVSLNSSGSTGRSSKPKGLCSAPVRIVRDNFMEQISHFCTKPTLAEVIKRACLASQARLSGTDDQGRVRREFYRPLTEEFLLNGGELTESLALAVGLDPEGAQLKLEVEPEPEADADDAEELFSFHIPTFDEYSYVFSNYPYVQVGRFEDETVLVIGTAQTRDAGSNNLYRRTCEVDLNDGEGKRLFKQLFSPYCQVLERIDGDKHQHIKLVPLRPGTRIRFWTNVKDQGDIDLYYRYMLLVDNPGDDTWHLFTSQSDLDSAYNIRFSAQESKGAS